MFKPKMHTEPDGSRWGQELVHVGVAPPAIRKMAGQQPHVVRQTARNGIVTWAFLLDDQITFMPPAIIGR